MERNFKKSSYFFKDFNRGSVSDDIRLRYINIPLRRESGLEGLKMTLNEVYGLRISP